jgi:hypothetical protein
LTGFIRPISSSRRLIVWIGVPAIGFDDIFG